MQDQKGPPDEDIGRPGPWGANRYQKPGQSPGQSVLTPAGTAPGPEAPPSTPVTREDYESADQIRVGPGCDPPGGDAGQALARGVRTRGGPGSVHRAQFALDGFSHELCKLHG